MQRVKAFLASPEGAAAITGFIRAAATLAVGFGVAVSQADVDTAVKFATSAMLVVNIVLSFFTVKVVQSRADTEEAEAALSSEVLETNKSDLLA